MNGTQRKIITQKKYKDNSYPHKNINKMKIKVLMLFPELFIINKFFTNINLKLNKYLIY